MAIYRFSETGFVKLDETTFANEGIRERQDLQRILKESIDVIAPGTLVIAEEFGEWTGSQRRIDLLAIDRDANLVVIELKRTQDGGHMELQAVRYAAMISAMTYQRAVSVYADYLQDSSLAVAEEGILNFLGWESPNEEDFCSDVRIVLASGEFSRELTTSVLWLNDNGLDIRCIRMKPYQSDSGLLVNIEQVIPLPEAEEFQVSVREKRIQQRRDQANRDIHRRDLSVNGKSFSSLPKRRIIFEVVSAVIETGTNIEDIRGEMPKSKWISVEGELDRDDFIEAAHELKARTDDIFNPARYYTQSEDLFHAGGMTYALSNQWGYATQAQVSKLEDRYNLAIEIDW